MCGIFAYLGNYYNLEYLNDFFQKINSRGPDDSSLIQLDSNVIFGFHRLSINGLNNLSNQPLVYNNLTLICNGEIYNHNELIKKYNFITHTNSDCEVILHLYERFGIQKTLIELDGVFSFIIKDNNNIICARDPIGVRPCFIGYSDKGIIISSEAKCNVDISNSTIYQLQPGSYQIFKNSKYSFSGLYYKLPFKVIPFSLTIYDTIKKLLDMAVKKRLMSERPIGALLSGGLDSSIIVYLANNYITNLNTFSIGLKGSPDIKYALSVSKLLNTKHHEVIVSLDDFINSINKVIYTLETYDITTIRASVPNYLISKYISENTNIKVILSGEGADELFGGYLYFHNSPTNSDFKEETENLINNLYKFDVLRCDRTTAAHGLEVRVPFLDLKFLNYIVRLAPELKSPIHNNNIEKYILRKSFDKCLPDDIIWRQKDAFSDAVGYNWVTELKKFIDTQISDDDFNNSKNKYLIDPPICKEGLYYRRIFEEYYPNKASLIGYTWRPKWSETTEPSAVALKQHKH